MRNVKVEAALMAARFSAALMEPEVDGLAAAWTAVGKPQRAALAERISAAFAAEWNRSALKVVAGGGASAPAARRKAA
jgi:hypothetical protein